VVVARGPKTLPAFEADHEEKIPGYRIESDLSITTDDQLSLHAELYKWKLAVNGRGLLLLLLLPPFALSLFGGKNNVALNKLFHIVGFFGVHTIK